MTRDQEEDVRRLLQRAGIESRSREISAEEAARAATRAEEALGDILRSPRTEPAVRGLHASVPSKAATVVALGAAAGLALLFALRGVSFGAAPASEAESPQSVVESPGSPAGPWLGPEPATVLAALSETADANGEVPAFGVDSPPAPAVVDEALGKVADCAEPAACLLKAAAALPASDRSGEVIGEVWRRLAGLSGVCMAQSTTGALAFWAQSSGDLDGDPVFVDVVTGTLLDVGSLPPGTSVDRRGTHVCS